MQLLNNLSEQQDLPDYYSDKCYKCQSDMLQVKLRVN